MCLKYIDNLTFPQVTVKETFQNYHYLMPRLMATIEQTLRGLKNLLFMILFYFHFKFSDIRIFNILVTGSLNLYSSFNYETLIIMN